MKELKSCPFCGGGDTAAWCLGRAGGITALKDTVRAAIAAAEKGE
jgi:hypothetical protein